MRGNNGLPPEILKYLNVLDVLEIVRQPINIISADGILQYVNQAWIDLYKIPREEAVHKHICSITDLMRDLNYYLSLDSVADLLPENITFPAEKYGDVSPNTPACLQAVEKRREVLLFTQGTDGSHSMVRSTPVFDDAKEIVLVVTVIQNITRVADWQALLDRERRKNELIQSELSYLRENQASSKLIGMSKEIISLRKLITTVARSDASILITGESGVGKEVVAKEIYRQSYRKDGPFISVNCAAIPENLLESELFGYEKGAFTGAYKSKAGLFEMANGGTIFLDEIGEFPLHLQPKLLRILQEREFRRVGGTDSISMDVRVIAATNRNLMEQVAAGKFRSDLFYRLNVIPIQIPPLRARREDISLLASSFLEIFNQKYQTSKYFLSQAMVLLEQQPWPGNVRELENVVERLVVITNGNAITPRQVSLLLNGYMNGDVVEDESVSFTLKAAVDELERKMITEALKTFKSTYKAAKSLGVSQSTLVRKAKALGCSSEMD